MVLTLPAGTPASDSMASYRGVVGNHFDMLERLRGQLADAQYERDKVFFSRVQALPG